MGQYLATGIVLKCSTEKANLEKYKITKDELIEEMQKQIYFAPEIYDLTEENEYYKFKLKTEIFENQLIPFLEQYYTLYYKNSNDYKQTLEKLKNSKAQHWFEIADQKSEQAFQIDKYGHNDVVYFKKDFLPEAEIYSTQILLTIEGKIIMETYGEHFNFFKYCLIKAFPDFEMAKAVRMYITG